MLFDVPNGGTGCMDAVEFNCQRQPLQPKIARFESEAALVVAAKKIVAPALSNVFGLEDEFDCNHGIADLVLYQLRQDWHLSDGLQHLSPRWAAALRSLPYRKAFTVDWFSESNLVTRRRALQTLHDYEMSGFCERVRSTGKWIKFRQPRPLVTKIYAIEAKLRDWQRALSQAARYRTFSHQAWVLLDEASIKPALAHIDRFSGLNVGLASLSTDGRFQRYYQPENRKPSDPWRFWFANVLIARSITQQGVFENKN